MGGRSAVELVEGGANTIPDASKVPLLAAVARHLKSASTNYVCHPQKAVIRLPCTVQGTTHTHTHTHTYTHIHTHTYTHTHTHTRTHTHTYTHTHTHTHTHTYTHTHTHTHKYTQMTA